MILDTSVIIAILNKEPERETALNILENADHIKIAAGTLMEATLIVQSRYGAQGQKELDIILESGAVQCVPSTRAHVSLVEKAFAQYGKGQGSKAQLNFGDCFAYALAKETNETLFFKGEDFLYTDLKLMRLT
ncbi:MAG: type II toxin-antitoxin system VapC family toxin [Pseudomonadota bacterium]